MKKARETPKKSKGFSLSGTPEILGKERKNTPKKQGKSENKKARKSKKSKDWRVRVSKLLNCALNSVSSARVRKNRYPRGPNLETIQDLSTRLKFSSEIETNDILKRD